ncbi:MAG: acyl-CoA reductase [Bacteroidetes bacterium]|nr:MAG: acyl-CoA reductase [Bacteroidota bacterium]
MKLEKRIEVMAQLGEHLLAENDEFLLAILKRTEFNNPWLTVENQQTAIRAIARQMLDKDRLRDWARQYDHPEPASPKTVGLVLAGNIPVVGFHDMLSVFIAGHKSQIKLSEKDRFVLPYWMELLKKMNPDTAEYFEIVERLSGFDAVIATGSNNSARYFEAYFGKYPHIIRRNRNSVAILDGTETDADLLKLGDDIFQYFGLGCRNVSKIYVPPTFDADHFLEVLHEFRELILHTKYKNNFDYNHALFMLNKVPFKNNGCLLLIESADIPSRIATLHYERYDDLAALEAQLRAQEDLIQCVVAKKGLLSRPVVEFGQTQSPGLTDYADGVDTMAFLKEL